MQRVTTIIFYNFFKEKSYKKKVYESRILG